MTVSTPAPLRDPLDGDALVSRARVQVTPLVLLLGMAVLGFLGYRAYTADPPIAAQVRAPDGRVVYTADDVRAGQALFLRKGLMEYGSIFGHGAYVGPDFTADYLHRAAQFATRAYGGASSDTARERVIADFKTNRYDAEPAAMQLRYQQTLVELGGEKSTIVFPLPLDLLAPSLSPPRDDPDAV